MIPVNFQAVEPEYSPEIVPDYKLYRYDKMSQRYYFEFVQGNAFAFISVTALASLLLPKGEGYMRWLMNLGDEAMYDREKKAAFGTAFHIEALRPLVEGGGYDFTELDHRIYDVVPARYHDSIGEYHHDRTVRPRGVDPAQAATGVGGGTGGFGGELAARA
jgi:hypothetical protein